MGFASGAALFSGWLVVFLFLSCAGVALWVGVMAAQLAAMLRAAGGRRLRVSDSEISAKASAIVAKEIGRSSYFDPAAATISAFDTQVFTR